MSTNESKEDYLERIYVLIEEQGFCKAIDLSKSMGFSKPSVSIALKKLINEGYVSIEDNHNLILSESGIEIAKKIYDRHNTLATALMALGVKKEQAYSDACRIEHDISEESFTAIKKHLTKNN